MPTKYVENLTNHTMYVGGKAIPAGEGRDIDVAYLPPEHQDEVLPVAVSAPSLDDLLTVLLAKGVKDVLPELDGLTQDALDRLIELENESATPRKTVLEAVKALQIKRAADQMDAQQAEKQKQFEADVEHVYNAQLALLTAEQRDALGEADHAELLTKARAEVSENGKQG